VAQKGLSALVLLLYNYQSFVESAYQRIDRGQLLTPASYRFSLYCLFFEA